jgi:hypothetical protein
VLDLARPGTEEDDDLGQATDRGYWVSRGSEASVAVASDSGADDLAYDKRCGCYRLRMTPKDIDVPGDLLLDLIRRASKTPPADEESPPPPLRYDRARASLDRHATYIVAAYVAGAAETRTRQERNPTEHLAGRRSWLPRPLKPRRMNRRSAWLPGSGAVTADRCRTE